MFWCKTHNFGDEIGPYLIERLSGSTPEYHDPRRVGWIRKRLLRKRNTILLSVGSIIDCSDESCIVWGSGIMSQEEVIHGGSIRAVRGPRTKERLDQLGIFCPNVFGDPALLLPLVFAKPSSKTQKIIGIIPHKLDYAFFKSLIGKANGMDVIDLTDEVENVIQRICSCEAIISTSLHGIIVAHAYGIPAVWMKRGDIDGDDVKFSDYFSSIHIKPYAPISSAKLVVPFAGSAGKILKETADYSLPDPNILQNIRRDLIDSAPFGIISKYITDA